ncbi:EamA family transporter [Rhodovibrionaceae bacterium A322]
MDPLIFALVLIAAIFHATWNALVKSGGDKLVMQTLVILAPSLIGLPALFFLPMISWEAVPWLALSTVIHFAYYGLLVSAYKHGDLSLVYPIARGSAPLLVALGAWYLAGEEKSWGELLGVVIVSLGIFSLAWRKKGAQPVDGGGKLAVGLALLTGLSIATYSLADGMGVRASGNAYSYIAWLFALEGLPLLAFTCWRRRGRVWASFQPHLVKGTVGGLVAGAAYGIVIWSLSHAPMAQVVALRETSVLIAAAIGCYLLREPFGHKRMAAAGLVAGGAMLLQLSG